MLFGEILRVAFQSIRANLLRAALTMLGIIIGVAAVIAMLAAGAGAQKNIEAQIDALGANVLNVTSENWFLRGVARQQMTLEVEDVWALQERARHLDMVVPKLEDRKQIKFDNLNLNLRIVGTTHEYLDLYQYELEHGRMFTEAEDLDRQRIAVVGYNVPRMLELEDPSSLVGQRIAIRGIPFTVIGIVEQVGGNNWRNPDDFVYLPIRTAELRVMGNEDLEDIDVRIREGVTLENAMVDIERVLRSEHKILPGQPNDFAIFDSRQILETREQAQQTFTILLASIAGVSLVVGGIGIMNIMLVSVTERTREIGVRMALGATRRNILLQFLVESMSMCLLGGLLGVVTGSGLAVLLSRTAGWDVYVSPESVALAFGFSLMIGLVFGLLPARRAANLDPIEALRYE